MGLKLGDVVATTKIEAHTDNARFGFKAPDRKSKLVFIYLGLGAPDHPLDPEQKLLQMGWIPSDKMEALRQEFDILSQRETNHTQQMFHNIRLAARLSSVARAIRDAVGDIPDHLSVCLDNLEAIRTGRLPLETLEDISGFVEDADRMKELYAKIEKPKDTAALGKGPNFGEES